MLWKRTRWYFLLSDNGALEKYGSNGVLRGQKTNLYEGGIRVPAIAYWKGKIKPAETDETSLTMDLLPTALAIAGAEVPQEQFDGVDFSKLLLEGKPVKERTVFWRYSDQNAARRDEWKLLITEQDTALYHLQEDIEETQDVSAEHPEITDELSIKLQQWEVEVDLTDMKTL